MKPSEALDLHRTEIRAIAARYRVQNIRVFGSVLIGEDTEQSDIDILVDALPGATLFHLGGLQNELEAVLGLRVDLLTPLDLPEAFRGKIVGEARPI